MKVNTPKKACCWVMQMLEMNRPIPARAEP